MARSHTLLAPGAAPLIGRMFETGAARAPAQAGGLPFVGTVLASQPGASITVARILALDHDLFLADHHFVHAPGVKPLADCFPVLPMTASLEVMAETAALLAPGCGLVGFEAVTARRWIALEDGAPLQLRIEGRLLDLEPHHGRRRIAVQVFAGAEPGAAIDATVLFGSHHDAAPPPRLQPVSGGAEHAAAALYGERWLFHGPRFQRLAGPVRITADGASAQVLAQPATDWFAGTPQPQLLTDPALLDTVGQLAALWAMQQGHAAFPIGIARLDLYGPTPAPGTPLPVRLRIRGQQLKMLSADVEIGDGEGGVWVRIGGWKSWQFHWAPQLVEFQRQPARTLLSAEQALPLPLPREGLACQRVDARTVAGFELALLARHYLHASEWQAFTAKGALPQRQRDWLLGRIVAKDAARAWCGQPDLHPAAFALTNDAAGQPRLAYWPAGWNTPFISIAHAGGQAVALAADMPVGIDIEQVRAHDAPCVAAFTTAQERLMLDAVGAATRDAWITRLWCAKEACGKRLGTGVTGGPGQFEAGLLAADFALPMRHAAGGADSLVRTMQDGEFILAFDIAVAGSSPGEKP